jgi:hypothetical protein
MKVNTTHNDSFFDLIPTRNLKWEDSDNGRIVLIVPKFRNRIAVKYFLPILPKPNMRVYLDAFGSYVWECCDGAQSIKNIAGKLREKFGASVEPADERTGQFIRLLTKEHFITLFMYHDINKEKNYVTSH